MKIVYDTRALEAIAPSGVRDIARGVLSGLELMSEFEGVEVVTVGTATAAPSRLLEHTRLARRGFMELNLPAAALSLRASHIFVPRQTVPPVSIVPSVPLFHDIGFLRQPRIYPGASRISWTSRIAGRRARAFSVSEYTRHEMKAAGFRSKVTSLPIQAVHAVDWVPREEEPYVLTVAAQEMHKNLLRLIDAWDQADTGSFQLVICGRSGRATPSLEERLGRLRPGKRVRLVSGLSSHEYDALLAGCWAYVQPSFYEGLCIPAQDLAAAGAPIVAAGVSNLGAMFAGAPSLQLFNPYSAASIAASIEAVLKDGGFRIASSEFNHASISLTDWGRVGEVILEGLG